MLNSLEAGPFPGTLLQLGFSDPWFVLGHACTYLRVGHPLAVPGTRGQVFGLGLLPVLGSECHC